MVSLLTHISVTRPQCDIWPRSLQRCVRYHVILYRVITAPHDDVIKWKHFPRYWPFVRRIHRSPVNSSHKGQWRGALMFSLICFWINDWVNNGEAGDLRRYSIHYDVIVMATVFTHPCPNSHGGLKKPPIKLWQWWVIAYHLEAMYVVTYSYHNLI